MTIFIRQFCFCVVRLWSSATKDTIFPSHSQRWWCVYDSFLVHFVFHNYGLGLFTFNMVYPWDSIFFLMHFVFKHRLCFISHVTLYLSHLALFWQGRNLFYSRYALNHDLYPRSETKALQLWLSAVRFSEVVFVSNRACPVNSKGLRYDHYIMFHWCRMSLNLLKYVCRYIKHFFMSAKGEFAGASGLLCGCYDESGEFWQRVLEP